jgi:hypothetical protein
LGQAGRKGIDDSGHLKRPLATNCVLKPLTRRSLGAHAVFMPQDHPKGRALFAALVAQQCLNFVAALYERRSGGRRPPLQNPGKWDTTRGTIDLKMDAEAIILNLESRV